jgi:hypothetical protein
VMFSFLTPSSSMKTKNNNNSNFFLMPQLDFQDFIGPT